MTDGVLYYENADSDRRRLVVPTELREEVVRENHEAVLAGHSAPKKMFCWLSWYYYWPGMRADVQKVCQIMLCVHLDTQGQEL